jgi:hypothetical protein
MIHQWILPSQEVREKIKPYDNALEALGVDARYVMDFALKTVHTEDYRGCEETIRHNLFDFQKAFDIPVPDQNRAIHVVMDAVGDALAVMEPLIHNAIGRIPRSIALRGFCGDDPIVSVIIDDPHEAQHYHSFGRATRR